MRSKTLFFKATIFVTALFISGSSSIAQKITEESKKLTSLISREDGTTRAMVIGKIDTLVKIRGLLAQTEITMDFHNPHARVLHAELMFPLPENATLCGYGLDINGKIVDASLVEKHKARIAFEKEVRKGVDPGIAEVVRGNQFRTRVYPIPAKGKRTIKIVYTSPLISDESESLYSLPINFDHKIPNFNLQIVVIGSSKKPTLKSSLSTLNFGDWQNQWKIDKKFVDYEQKEPIVVSIPNRVTQLVSVEKFSDDQLYFLINDSQAVKQASQKSKPNRIGLYWDASLSREKSDLKKDLSLLKLLFKKWDNTIVDLVLFRDRVEKVESFAVTSGKADKLIEKLEGVDYDGATDISAISFNTNVDFHLLFSDGMGSLGKVPTVIGSIPVYSINSHRVSDTSLLKYIAEKSGGVSISLNQVPVEKAVNRIGESSYSLLGVKVLSGEVEEIFPKGVVPIYGRADVCGVLKSGEASLELSYGINGKVMHKQRIALSNKDVKKSGIIARYWAQNKVTELSVFQKKHHDEIIKLGQKYHFVTPGTSLIVLENLSQFIEHNIEPPESRSAIHKQWLSRRIQKETNEKQRLQHKLNRVAKMWEQRVNWWERDYSKAKVSWNRIKGKSRLTQNSNDVFLSAGRRAVDLSSAAQVGGRGGEVSKMLERNIVISDTVEVEESEAISEVDMGLVLNDSNSDRLMGISGDASSMQVGSFSAKKQKIVSSNPSTKAATKLKAWDPKTPYMLILKNSAKKNRAYATYIAQRAGYSNSPSYFLDCAHFFYSHKNPKIGRRVLTNLIEMGLDNPAMMRIVAYRLGEAGDYDLQITILEEVLDLRPEEPQSYRDLALALTLRGEKNKNLIDLERAMALLTDIVKGNWDRFAEIEVIALMEINRILAYSKTIWGDKVLKPDLEEKFFKNLDVDMRIVMSWDVDMTDVDLWVIEPSGEKAYYSHNRTSIGGLVSRDFTQGYGPEEYLLKKMRSGKYNIKANYYGSNQQNLTGPATLTVSVFTNYGRPNEKRQLITLRLEKVQEVVEVGVVDLEELLKQN